MSPTSGRPACRPHPPSPWASSRRCSVCASKPELSFKRRAARPVGAASTSRRSCRRCSWRMVRSNVVFPTPGPPVRIDRDGDGLAEATAVSRVQGWMRRRFGVGQSTLTMPLLRPSLYSGVVLSAASDSLILSHGGGDALRDALALGPCYIEVTSGSISPPLFSRRLLAKLTLPCSHASLAGAISASACSTT